MHSNIPWIHFYKGIRQIKGRLAGKAEMDKEQSYIRKRIWKAKLQSILFYLCWIFPVRKKKIVFCCIEGTTGYSCNPKYIAEELIRRDKGYELIWLVYDMSK